MALLDVSGVKSPKAAVKVLARAEEHSESLTRTVESAFNLPHVLIGRIHFFHRLDVGLRVLAPPQLLARGLLQVFAMWIYP